MLSWYQQYLGRYNHAYKDPIYNAPRANRSCARCCNCCGTAAGALDRCLLSSSVSMRLKTGQVAVVTGGGAGMGRALCVQLAEAGLQVATCDIDEANLAGTVAECQAAVLGCRVLTFACDVADEQACLGFADAVAAGFGVSHINALFNNAGIGGGASFVDGSEQARSSWEATFNINWFGVYYMSRAFMPLLLQSEEGVVVNTSSVNGFWASLGTKVRETVTCHRHVVLPSTRNVPRIGE